LEKKATRLLSLLIDDAAELGDFDLKNLLQLTQLRAAEHPRCCVTLAGGSELLESVRRAVEPADFDQIHLAPFSAAETEAYIHHRIRLTTARSEPLFTRALCAIIAERSAGIPRAINDLCHSAMISGAKCRLQQIDSSILDNHRPNEDASEVPAPALLGDNGIREISVSPVSKYFSRIPVTLKVHWRIYLYSILSIATATLTVAAALWYLGELTPRAPANTATSRTSARRPEMLNHHTSSAFAQGQPPELKEFLTPSRNTADSTGKRSLESVVPGNQRIRAQANQSTLGLQLTQDPNDTYAVRNQSTKAAMSSDLAGVPSPSPMLSVDKRTSAQAKARTLTPRSNEAQIDAAADEFMEHGEYDKAIHNYQDILEVSPDDQPVKEKLDRARRAKAAEERVLNP